MLAFARLLAEEAGIGRDILVDDLDGTVHRSTPSQQLIQAMCLGKTADQLATGVLCIDPALTEVLEQAPLEL